ncbi:hypothetical protein GCM10010392_11130 [Streptomyces clavifer]|nr:hypothetical protein GCM10010392_11130 [Streptomyces clavifer]
MLPTTPTRTPYDDVGPRDHTLVLGADVTHGSGLSDNTLSQRALWRQNPRSEGQATETAPVPSPTVPDSSMTTR